MSRGDKSKLPTNGATRQVDLVPDTNIRGDHGSVLLLIDFEQMFANAHSYQQFMGR